VNHLDHVRAMFGRRRHVCPTQYCIREVLDWSGNRGQIGFTERFLDSIGLDRGSEVESLNRDHPLASADGITYSSLARLAVAQGGDRDHRAGFEIEHHRGTAIGRQAVHQAG